MQDLAKLTIEELENILAVAPYSQLHQMMYSIKKSEKEKGALYQFQEGALFALENEQQELSEKIIQQLTEDEKSTDEVPVIVTEEISISEKEDAAIVQLRSSVPGTEGEKEKTQDLPITEKKKEKKKSKKKKKKSTENIPEKEKTQKTKKKKEKKSVKVKPEKTKKKKKVKSDKKKKVKKLKSKHILPIAKDKKSKKSKDNKAKKDVTLSDFSQWLLAQSKESTMTDFSFKKSSKKSSKKKNKIKKKDKGIISEPLANLLAKQGHNEEAIKMYEQLSLIFPEKSAFFAAKIEKLKKDK